MSAADEDEEVEVTAEAAVAQARRDPPFPHMSHPVSPICQKLTLSVMEARETPLFPICRTLFPPYVRNSLFLFVAQLGRGVLNSGTNMSTEWSSGDGRGAAGGAAGGGIMLMPAEESMGAGVYGGPPSGVLRAGGAVPTVASPELRQQFDAIYAKYSC